MVRPSLRTRSVGARLTAAEYASLERQAEASGQSLSEWCREVMLASVNGQAPKNRQSVGTEVQAVMAEIVALRTILLNVIYKQANGESLTAEEMQRLIERADADKLKKAADRLQQGSKSSST
ncbi:MAG: hypothetical protein DMG30_03630 [Acidobacteria bacterium]|nr:MAG: hypothetical protein DMG30_03630 [Acidobacteriota bacterium]